MTLEASPTLHALRAAGVTATLHFDPDDAAPMGGDPLAVLQEFARTHRVRFHVYCVGASGVCSITNLEDVDTVAFGWVDTGPSGTTDRRITCDGAMEGMQQVWERFLGQALPLIAARDTW